MTKKEQHVLLTKETVGTKHLLTIPSTDIGGTAVNSASASSGGENCNSDDDDDDEIVLLQMPTTWNKEEVQNGCHFIANKKQKTSNNNNNNTTVSLLTKTQSYTVHRVETSNVLVLIPPPKTNDDDDERKRLKGSTGIDSILQCQLLKTATTTKNTSASFLELRETQLNLAELLAIFRTLYIYDPYDKNTLTQNGISCTELMNRLHISRQQIVAGVREIQAFALPNSERYVLLSEESKQECYTAIIATLTEEVDICSAYGGIGIVLLNGEETTTSDDNNTDETELLKCFVQNHVVQRMCPEERFDDDVYVLVYCLQQLRASTTKNRFVLCKTKVAKIVAHRLFRKHQKSRNHLPIKQSDFMELWQSTIPGVGKEYAVSRSMLHGIAVAVTSSNNEQKETNSFQYLPVSSISTKPAECFRTLFETKDQWTKHELQPYIEHVVLHATDSTTCDELLLQYTDCITSSEVVVKNDDGTTTVQQFYVKKV